MDQVSFEQLTKLLTAGSRLRTAVQSLVEFIGSDRFHVRPDEYDRLAVHLSTAIEASEEYDDSLMQIWVPAPIQRTPKNPADWTPDKIEALAAAMRREEFNT